MVLVRLPVALLLSACGASSAPLAATAGAEPDSAAGTAAVEKPPAGETPECKAERLAILDSVAASQARSCASDAECATATNPGSFVKEFDVVVNTADREALDVRSRAHLDRCGAFYYYEPINAIRVVTAACRDGRCAEEETVLHVDE